MKPTKTVMTAIDIWLFLLANLISAPNSSPKNIPEMQTGWIQRGLG